jgi:hypothetical protein
VGIALIVEVEVDAWAFDEIDRLENPLTTECVERALTASIVSDDRSARVGSVRRSVKQATASDLGTLLSESAELSGSCDGYRRANSI